MAKGKVLIVGAGIGGLTLAYALVKRGFSVEIMDQGAIPNPVSSSHDEHRIIRHAYGPHIGYGLMMPAAYAAWDRLFADTGHSHFHETGWIFVARGGDTSWVEASQTTLARTGVPIRRLSLGELADRLPMLKPDNITDAFETGGAGLLFNRRIMADLIVWLTAAGVTFRPFTKALQIDTDAARVETEAGTLSADLVVVAAGAWMPKLLPQFAGDSVASRQAILYVAPTAAHAAGWSKAPVVVVFDGQSGTFTIPPRQGTRMKIGDHVFSMVGDPDGDRIAGPADLDNLMQAAAKTYKDFADYTILEPKICFYTVRDHEKFLVRDVGQRGFVLSACSGHGFKLAPLMAETLADGIAGLRPMDEVTRFSAGEDHGA